MAENINLHLEDNSMEVQGAIHDAIIAFLHEAAGELRSQTQRNTPVDTGQLKGSWKYKISESEKKATIGSPIENAIWNEYGTGQYALHGDGRKTPWKYKDIRGKWHTTTGKKPQRSLHKAFTTVKPRLQALLAERLRGL